MRKPTQKHLESYDSFLAHTGPDRLQKIFAREELFKRVLDVPGHIVECGVFKGSGIYTFAKLRWIYKPNSQQKIIGFDFFDTDRSMSFKHDEDQAVLDEHADGWATREDILLNLENMGIGNIELIAGNVVNTTQKFAEENLGFRISLLYLDIDNYEGTLAVLRNFYSLVTVGGIVVFDEYAYRGYGEADAVDEFFKDKNVTLTSLPWANTPTAFFRKETA